MTAAAAARWFAGADVDLNSERLRWSADWERWRDRNAVSPGQEVDQQHIIPKWFKQGQRTATVKH
jgi:hypothetical protein